jgi:hypothetical protein
MRFDRGFNRSFGIGKQDSFKLSAITCRKAGVFCSPQFGRDVTRNNRCTAELYLMTGIDIIDPNQIDL